jgi:hypothetical protein
MAPYQLFTVFVYIGLGCTVGKYDMTFFINH